MAADALYLQLLQHESQRMTLWCVGGLKFRGKVRNYGSTSYGTYALHETHMEFVTDDGESMVIPLDRIVAIGDFAYDEVPAHGR